MENTILVNTGERIAGGRTAEIFAWGDGCVLKLLRPGYPAEDAVREAATARLVQAAGVPVPAVHAVIEVAGRTGIVTERVDGPSMLQALSAHPGRILRYARLLADLQATLHACVTSDLPSGRRRLSAAIADAAALPVSWKEAAWGALARLPEGAALCHGDFHPANIILSPRGPVILDWMDASAGHPLADVARTALLLQLGGLPPETPRRWMIILLRRVFYAAYLNRYLRRRAADRRVLAAWHGPVAAARLAEQVPGEERALLRRVAATVPRCRLCGE